MNESEFMMGIVEKLRIELGQINYEVEAKKNLPYRLIINSEGDSQPSTRRDRKTGQIAYVNPKRGDLAFQTDILIWKRGSFSLPRVVIETKYRNPTSHTLITYSTKASKHKEVFPYLRYGLVVGGENYLDISKFLVHNSGFDFALAMNDTANIEELTHIVKNQLRTAELLLKFWGRRGGKAREYVSTLEIE
jgi:hypothetical protein